MDKTGKNVIKYFFMLFPFLLVYLGSILINVDATLSTNLKLSAFFYMFFYVLVHRKVNKELLYSTLLFLIVICYGIYNSFYWKAGVEDAVRYLFPVVVLFYGYSIRKYFDELITFVVIFVVLNFLVQIINYINWMNGVDQWYYKTISGYRFYPQTMGMLRATGFVTAFAFYGFMNLIAFFLIQKYYTGKHKMLILIITGFSLFASLSYKTFAAVIIILVLYYYKKLFKTIVLFFILFLAFSIANPKKINQFVYDIEYRINAYLVSGKSTRGDSYRIMFNQILKPNLFGTGIGTFGGPASTKYKSPYYKKLGFNWYDMEWANLSTTDTYPPHPVVELGIIGTFIYVLVLITPILRRKIKTILLVIYFSLFIDLLFTFSLNNLEYLMFSLVFVYPIIYNKNTKVNRKIKEYN